MHKKTLDPQRYLDLGDQAYEAEKLVAATLYYQFSIDIYEAAPDEYPDYDYAEAYYNLGCIYFDDANYIEASNCIAKAISIKSHPQFHLDLGHCYHRMEHYQRAIAKFNWLIANDPTYGFAFYRRGRSFECIDEIGLAIHDYSVALMLNPNLKKAERALSDLLDGLSKQSVYKEILSLSAEKSQYCLAVCNDKNTLLYKFFSKDRPFFFYGMENVRHNQTVFNTDDIETQCRMIDSVRELKKPDSVNRNQLFLPSQKLMTKSNEASIELRTNVRQNFRK